MNKNKLIALGLSAIMALSLVACGSANTPSVQPPSNFADFASLSEAIQDAGFDINVPQAIEGYDECSYRSDKTDGMLEVIFKSGDEDIRFRKAVGEDDPSGNYNKFSETETVAEILAFLLTGLSSFSFFEKSSICPDATRA